ncbi:unnamed protein product [Urochloa humidicola]
MGKGGAAADEINEDDARGPIRGGEIRDGGVVCGQARKEERKEALPTGREEEGKKRAPLAGREEEAPLAGPNYHQFRPFSI